jgi:hypothetical protein
LAWVRAVRHCAAAREPADVRQLGNRHPRFKNPGGITMKPPGGIPRIEAIWLALTTNVAGNEQSAAVLLDGKWFPLMVTDEARLPDLAAKAQRFAEAKGQPVTIVKLSAREDVAAFPVEEEKP